MENFLSHRHTVLKKGIDTAHFKGKIAFIFQRAEGASRLLIINQNVPVPGPHHPRRLSTLLPRKNSRLSTFSLKRASLLPPVIFGCMFHFSLHSCHRRRHNSIRQTFFQSNPAHRSYDDKADRYNPAAEEPAYSFVLYFCKKERRFWQ